MTGRCANCLSLEAGELPARTSDGGQPIAPLFILASASPRRRELVRLLGVPWHRLEAAVDESIVDDRDPGANVVKTAALKAGAVAHRAPPQAVILAADTAVVVDGEMLGKPADAADARQMLKSLRGRTHQVYTGIVIVNKAVDRVAADLAVVDVPIRSYGDDEIDAYIATGDPLDKAGAYGIQHPGFRPVAHLTGCYAAVVGLPLCHVARTLHQVGVSLPADVAAACQAHHNYRCPIFTEVLAGTGDSGVTDRDLAKYLRPVESQGRTS
jgi:MAF protein